MTDDGRGSVCKRKKEEGPKEERDGCGGRLSRKR